MENDAADEIVLEGPLDRADFDTMAAMEARCYGSELITPAEEAWRWYLRFPYTTVAAREHGGGIAGFVNLFPVRDEVYRGLVGGTFNDADLVADDVVDLDEVRAHGLTVQTPLHMFLSCIVVEPAWRHGRLSGRLLLAAARQFDDVAPLVEDVVVDTATPAGAGLAQRLGFEPLCATGHGTMVWRQGYGRFLSALGVGTGLSAGTIRAENGKS